MYPFSSLHLLLLLAMLHSSMEKNRHQILREFLSLISDAGAEHTGVHAEDFTEEMMVPLPMDNYEDLDVSSGLVAPPRVFLVFSCSCPLFILFRLSIFVPVCFFQLLERGM